MDSNTADFYFSGPVKGLSVSEFSGEEPLSGLFQFDITLIQSVEYGAMEVIPSDLMLGAPAALEILGQQASRRICGILESFVLLSVSAGKIEYQARLVSSFAPLTLNLNSRIFQGMSTPQIIGMLLEERGYGGQHTFELSQTYAPRDYCVQYQESDWAFLSRLMEEEGIFFFFRHDANDVLILGDGAQSYDDIGTLRYRDEATSHLLYDEALRRFEVGASLRPTSAAMRDYRFKSPNVRLDATRQGASGFGGGELYYYPGEYMETSIGNRLAAVRIEEAQTGRVSFVATGNTRQGAPGRTFVLTGNSTVESSERWLVTRVSHRGEAIQALEEEALDGNRNRTHYTVKVEGIPATHIFRPARQTPRPRIPGLQPAVVVGPPGETIYPDSWGRVKVKFYWDRTPSRNENCSCWIRVNQGWAGAGYGVFFLPRIGQEVLVLFIEGDPDRPVIIGRAYNDVEPVPHPLPDRRTVSTLKTNSVGGAGYSASGYSAPGYSAPGYNELRFEDRAGCEEIFIHGQKDWNIVIENNKGETIHSDKYLNVTHNHTIEIGKNRTESISQNEALSVGMNRTQQIGISEQRQIQETRVEAIGSNDGLKVGYNLLTQVKKNQSIRVKGHKKVQTTDFHLVKSGEKCVHLSTQESLQAEAQVQILLLCGKSAIALKQGGELLLVGQQVQLEGSAEVKIEGGLIKINCDDVQAVETKQGAPPPEQQAKPEARGVEDPAKAGQKPNVPKGSPLDTLWPYMEKSPSMMEDYQNAVASGRLDPSKVTYGPSAYDWNGGIKISSNASPDAQAAILAHELQHANQTYPNVPCEGLTQEQWAEAQTNAVMQLEGEAELAAATAERESGGAIRTISKGNQEIAKIEKDPNMTWQVKCTCAAHIYEQNKPAGSNQNYHDYYKNIFMDQWRNTPCGR